MREFYTEYYGQEKRAKSESYPCATTRDQLLQENLQNCSRSYPDLKHTEHIGEVSTEFCLTLMEQTNKSSVT